MTDPLIVEMEIVTARMTAQELDPADSRRIVGLARLNHAEDLVEQAHRAVRSALAEFNAPPPGVAAEDESVIRITPLVQEDGERIQL